MSKKNGEEKMRGREMIDGKKKRKNRRGKEMMMKGMMMKGMRRIRKKCVCLKL